MNTEEERELFDKWYGKKPRGWFEAVRYNTAWRAWLASANREGYRLAPVDPSEKALNAMWDALNGNAESMDCIERSYKAMIGACDDH